MRKLWDTMTYLWVGTIESGVQFQMAESPAWCIEARLSCVGDAELHKLHSETFVIVAFTFWILLVADDDLRDVIEQVFSVVMSILASMASIVLGIFYSFFPLEQLFVY